MKVKSTRTGRGALSPRQQAALRSGQRNREKRAAKKAVDFALAPTASARPVDSTVEPAWLGSDLGATVTKVEVVEGPSKKGKQIVLGLAIRVDDKFWAHLPAWLPSASHQDDLEYRMSSCKLSQPKCRIGITFKGREPEKGDQKIESCTLQPGLTVRLSIDPKKPEAEACIKLRIDYTQERVKFFGDHMDALVRFRAFTAKSEQQALPMGEGKKAA